jgi:hypothetical protein
VSGSSTQPITLIARLHLERLPLAGDGTIVPVASMAQPVVILSTSSA